MFWLTAPACRGSNKNIHQYWTYNQNHKTASYTYDSLAPGTYTFYTRDLWGQERKLVFLLQRDTSIILPAIYQQVTQLSLKDLQQADSIVMRYKSSGCFHKYIDHIVLKKSKDEKNYSLTITNEENRLTDKATHLPASIISDLYATISATKDIETDLISTSTKSFWVLAGSKLFYFHDSSGEWQGYPYYQSKYIKRTRQQAYFVR